MDLASNDVATDGLGKEPLVIQTVETFFIHTIAYTAAPYSIYHTVFVGGQKIHAAIALSGVSQGATAQGAGSVSAFIKRWGHFTSPGHEVEEDPTTRPENNAIEINACTFVTFGLTAALAEGYAVGSVFYFA